MPNEVIGGEIALELTTYNIDADIIEYKRVLNHPYVVVNHPAGKEVISGGINMHEADFLLATQKAFDFAEQILMAEEMDFGHIYHQWNHIGSPLLMLDNSYGSQQNYQIFNEIRAIFYEPLLFTNGK